VFDAGLSALKPESLRSRGWATAIVGILFLAIGMLAAWYNSQTLGAFVATGGDQWMMIFWVIEAITGAALVAAGILIVAIGYLEENLKR